MRTESDAELIKAYAERDDQGAFTEIISRHGGMVYRVCFRKLVNRHDAEDASQAVFMTLVRKSKQVKWESSLARWLYTVARQTALFMARTRVRYVQKESAALEIMESELHPQFTAHDQETALKFLDNELAALSEVQREAIILRYLDGMSEKDAALAAGCSANAMSSRLGDGILNLRQRLVKRGCALGVPVLIGVLEADAQAAVPETLIPSLMAVPKLAAAGAAAGTASANIIFLMEGVLKTMAIAKIKTAGIGILIALLIGTTGVMAVKEIQKRQTPGASEKPDIAVSPAKQEVHNQPKSSKLETKDKTQPAKVKQPPKARNFKAEMEEALARSLKEEDYYSKLDTIMREWASKDPVAASEWVMKLPEGNVKDNILFAVAYEWAVEDPVAASEWVIKLSEGQGRDVAISSVANIWSMKDPVAAYEWAMKLPAGKGRDRALSQIASSCAAEDPVAASEWVMKFPEGQARDMAIVNVACNWAMKDPVAASEWAMQLPEGQARDMALRNVACKLAMKDPVAASDFVMKLPEGEARNGALGQVAAVWSMKDPVAASDWAMKFPEGKNKDTLLNVVARVWKTREPEKAKNWIEKSSLSQEEKDKLLKQIEKISR